MNRVFSEYGPTSIPLTFSIIQSSKPVIVIQNIEEYEIESLEVETLKQFKIPVWVHDIFVWYADEIISENNLLFSIKYLISEEIINVD
jgi:hypothetical protein